MNTATFSVEIDGKKYKHNFNLEEVIEDPVTPPPPAPDPEPAPTVSKYVMLNVINWQPSELLTNAPATEYTYFVLKVSSAGYLLGINWDEMESFVNHVHGMGKKATFSVGGGAQSSPDIEAAIRNAQQNLINEIVYVMQNKNFDGVTLDIENTALTAQEFTGFVSALRAAMPAGKIIGMYTQPYQINTVHALTQDVADKIDWLSPMIYDAGPFNLNTFETQTEAWLPKVGNDPSKLLGGVAVNYPANDGGLDTNLYGQVLDKIAEKGWRGVGIWQNTIYTQPWQDVTAAKWTVE